MKNMNDYHIENISIGLEEWRYLIRNSQAIWCLNNDTYGTLSYTSYAVREFIHIEEM